MKKSRISLVIFLVLDLYILFSAIQLIKFGLEYAIPLAIISVISLVKDVRGITTKPK